MTTPLVEGSRAALVLAAIVLGLVLGAMTCAAGLADGNGHAAHAAAAPAVLESDHGIHAIEHRSHGEARVAPASTTGVDDPSAAPPAEGHPGLACLIPVDLRFIGPAAVTSSDVCASRRPAMLADRSGEIDPPVPRAS